MPGKKTGSLLNENQRNFMQGIKIKHSNLPKMRTDINRIMENLPNILPGLSQDLDLIFNYKNATITYNKEIIKAKENLIKKLEGTK